MVSLIWKSNQGVPVPGCAGLGWRSLDGGVGEAPDHQVDEDGDQVDRRTTGNIDPAPTIAGVADPGDDPSVAEASQSLGEGVGRDRLVSGKVSEVGSATEKEIAQDHQRPPVTEGLRTP